MAHENETPTSNPTPLEQAAATVGMNEEARAQAAANEVAEPNALFPYAPKLSEETMALRDDLSKVQTRATEAAQLSGDHFSRLLYGPDADRHLSPYGVPPTPNSLDSRKP